MSLTPNQERNARALEVAGRLVSELIGDVRVGMFDLHVTPQTREDRRTEMAREFGDLTKKLAGEIVSFI